MSKNCGNPNCITHGEDARTKVLREAKERVGTNPELMDIIRTLAANADACMTDAMGMSGNPIAAQSQTMMLEGEFDEHPAIQGVMNGFAVLLSEHRPTMEYFAATNDIPKCEGFILKSRIAAHEAADKEADDFMKMAFGTPEDMVKFLKGRM